MRTCVRIFNKVNKLKLAVDRSSQQRLSRHCLRTKPDVFTSGDADFGNIVSHLNLPPDSTQAEFFSFCAWFWKKHYCYSFKLSYVISLICFCALLHRISELAGSNRSARSVTYDFFHFCHCLVQRRESFSSKDCRISNTRTRQPGKITVQSFVQLDSIEGQQLPEGKQRRLKQVNTLQINLESTGRRVH